MHTTKGKDQLLARLRRLAGQIAALERAVEGDKSCSIVLHQAAGIRGAVSGLMDELIEEHLREHVARPDLNEIARAAGADELMAAIRRYKK